ncbi:MAG: oxygen-independent coproporphyrinogen III oxidase, partial [Mollicutes bacterium]|nr:oxygen-independent coproporphyrinogen III oxidase [Mollicutes bacterium]
LKIQHISCYSLIIEEHTKIYNKVKDIDEDLNYQMYCLINKTLSDHNFDHYEISNYAQSGFISRHNLKYWTNQQYYGFGLSAAAHNNIERTINTKNISEYLKHNYIYEREKLTPELKMEYEVMLGLRLLRGIDIENLVNKYKIDFYNRFAFDKLVQEGYLIKNNNKISVSENNLFRLNEILINLLDLNQKEDE